METQKIQKRKSSESSLMLSGQEWSLISVPKTLNDGVATWKDATKISQIRRSEAHTEELINIVANELVNFIGLISTPSSIKTENIWMVSKMFINLPNVKHLSVNELKYFFGQMYSFTYGKIYGAFGWDTLVDWFNQFFETRMDVFANHSEDEHARNVGAEKAQRSKPFEFGMSIGEILNKE